MEDLISASKRGDYLEIEALLNVYNDLDIDKAASICSDKDCLKLLINRGASPIYLSEIERRADMCLICFDQTEEIVKILCNHSFHRECLTQSKFNKCPYCSELLFKESSPLNLHYLLVIVFIFSYAYYYDKLLLMIVSIKLIPIILLICRGLPYSVSLN